MRRAQHGDVDLLAHRPHPRLRGDRRLYRFRARARGLASRSTPYVVGGVAIAVALTSLSVWASHRVLVGQRNILGWHVDAGELYRFIGPAAAIGLALFVLAFVDRSIALVAVTVVYLLVVIDPVNSGRYGSTSPWGFAPHIAVDGAVLLLAAAGFALAQRPLRPLATAAA